MRRGRVGVRMATEFVDEHKVIFKENDDVIRILRGRVTDDTDPDFITVERRDGLHKIGKKFIVKIEKLNNNFEGSENDK